MTNQFLTPDGVRHFSGVTHGSGDGNGRISLDLKIWLAQIAFAV
jgi:hypothetical protein